MNAYNFKIIALAAISLLALIGCGSSSEGPKVLEKKFPGGGNKLGESANKSAAPPKGV